jgi:hypothetical protein
VIAWFADTACVADVTPSFSTTRFWFVVQRKVTLEKELYANSLTDTLETSSKGPTKADSVLEEDFELPTLEY